MGRTKPSERRERNEKNLAKMKSELASFCEIGGVWSTLELVVIASARLGLTVRGDIHPNGQIKFIYEKMKKSQKPKVNKCKTKKDFYSSRAWKILRYQAFEKYGNRCQCCGATIDDGITLHVDHIKPRSKYPELALDLNNLQILCKDCNIGKINQWDTDWRP
jgi:5-methylcytosine-specific restriction endonuclease McrA